MVKSNLIVAALALSLGACAAQNVMMNGKPKSIEIGQEFLLGFRLATTPQPDPCLVQIFLVQESPMVVRLTVNHEPVYTKACTLAGYTTITWQLVDSAGYVFVNKDGIKFKGTVLPGPSGLDCKLLSGKVIQCTFTPQVTVGKIYGYAITVYDASGSLPVLDPTVFNN